MSDPIIAVAKIGKNVKTSTDPNDFIFHSNYNTFKIILEGTVVYELEAIEGTQEFSIEHGLSFTPLVTAFAKDNSANRVFGVNSQDITGANARGGLLTTGITFNYVSSDALGIYFDFSNTGVDNKFITVKYYCLEDIAV